MEDDSDTSLTIDESETSDKRGGNNTTPTSVISNTVSESYNSPKLVEGDKEVRQICDDAIKSVISHDSAVTHKTKCDDKNVDLLAEDIDVPKSPKKVNGEVKLSTCEKNEQESNVDVNNSNTGMEKTPLSDGEKGDTETELKNSKKDKQINSLLIDTKSVKEDGANSDCNVEYKGFKKKIIAQQSIASNNISDNVPISHSASLGSSKSNTKSKRAPSKRNTANESQHVLVSHPVPDGTQSSAQLTEYAQYLGLQPTVKFKCFKCGESGFPSMPKLQEHQNLCFKNINKMHSVLKPTSPPSTAEPSPSTNFRITRKVYLCSACGTYYENWNLFLHMREVHKRHICLFCLGMFSQADKLAGHLAVKHGVVEGLFTSSEHFVNEIKLSCFLMCCTCERIFTSERDNFYNHSCSEGLIINAEKACSLCGLKGAHFPTCRRAFTDRSASPPTSSTISNALERPAEPVQNSQLALQDQNASAANYLIPVSKDPDKICDKGNDLQENVSEGTEKCRDLSDIDDDYDISSAASYCHVNIHEPLEKQIHDAPKAKTSKSKSQDDIDLNVVRETESCESSPTAEKNENVENNIDTNSSIEEKPETEKSTEDIAGDTAEKKSEDIVNNIDESNKPLEETADNIVGKEDVEKEPDVTDIEDQQDLEREQLLKTPVKDIESDQNEETEVKKETDLELSPPTELSEKQPPKLDANLKEPPHTDRKQTVKNASATDAESESESSGSDEESDGSSSSDASSEESDHPGEIKNQEKMEESDVDNTDNDKKSVVVNENRSDEETEPSSKDIDNEGKEEEEEEEDEAKENEDVDMKLDEPKSDPEVADNGVDETEEKSVEEDKVEESGESIQLAGDDVPLLELTLEENLETMNIQLLLKESVKVSCINCVYCNHAKKIAVNGKQLALHLLAEHRFAPVVCSDSGELTEADGFVDKLRNSLSELQQMFFNTDSYDNMDSNFMQPYDRTYECFHCHFVTTLHKELYVHNRKMHQKTILLCIMCKSNFYSYSELLCHLCPGIYVPESNIGFRCCLCTVDGLPSAFRLMVHLRKRHHACDVCLETTGDQQKLSNHVWKHKLHHLCYRCGIAYRNKPDITKHLFWKHGTESVLCKKCLQKKWPHVYHFCIPPNAFICEECNTSFSRAVQLKVHKRLHAGDLPYPCNECEERFISRKLLIKHQHKHREPPLQIGTDTNMQENGPLGENENLENVDKPNVEGDKTIEENEATSNSIGKQEDQSLKDPIVMVEKNVTDDNASVPGNSGELPKTEEKDTGEKKTKVMDVYDLPPLNLSSESDDSDEEMEKKQVQSSNSERSKIDSQIGDSESTKEKPEEKIPENESQAEDDDTQQQIEVVDGIWDNFKTYKANLERRENKHIESEEDQLKISEPAEQSSSVQSAQVVSIINLDHDYCVPSAESSSQAKEQLEITSKLEGETSHALSPLSDAEKTEEIKEKTDDEMKACDADHNYCFSNTSAEGEKEKEQPIELAPSTMSPSKKKQKSPKKKQKRSASSSSSDSSSNSDSSTCSCGTNCSCSGTSSSSSGSSSSQSSDSDSSSSEGRRRQAARKERKKERARKKKLEETGETEEAQLLPPSKSPKLEVSETAANGPPEQEETAPAPTVAEPEETELQIRESDLDTDETETDEDFYDKHPQRLANKLLAEKRNQLLLLAAVAPVNNGSMSQSCQSPAPSLVEEPVPKKKAKTKRRRKSQHQHTSSENKEESRIKLNIPADYYSTHQSPAFPKSNLLTSSTTNSINTSLATPAPTVQSPFLTSHLESSTPTASYQSTGSGSETDSKRLSKRKRVPKRFYGDSSDEEHEQPPAKWRKVSTNASNSPLSSAPPPPPPSSSSFTYKSTPVTVPEPFSEPPTAAAANEENSEEEDEEAADDSDSDHEDAKKSSSESSNSESEGEKEQNEDDPSDADSEVESSPVVQTNAAPPPQDSSAVQQKNENLYCYCQCPYDEVSEMIACDGKHCRIEWFHFECVGIMVPPKGKWFCPDCRRPVEQKNNKDK